MLAELPLLARYTVTGTGAVYAIPFRVYRAEDVAVTFSTNGRTETALTLGKDYSVQILPGGGAELTLATGVVPAGAVLAIASAVPATQEADLSSTATVDTAALETQLDREVQMIQQLEEGLARAVKLPAASNGSPEELLEDVFTARDEAVDSATSAKASATAAAGSALAAAGSAAIATEEREAACACAGEAKDARDVAIAQTEAANILMEAELAKVNAIVAANKTDQQAAVTAARAWAEKAPDTPVEYDEDGNAHYSAQHWADRAQKLANNPDGETITVDADGVLKALGGNLLLNDEVWITESGSFTVPVKSWYEVLCINGGQAGGVALSNNIWAKGGDSGAFETKLMYLQEGEEVSVSIGAGGLWNSSGNIPGGITTFGDFSPNRYRYFRGDNSLVSWYFTAFSSVTSVGGGLGAYDDSYNMIFDARYYGGGGSAIWVKNSTNDGADLTRSKGGDGYQGVVRLRFWNPAKTNGPAPAMFAVRRMAARATPTVNLYNPETGQGSVWREEDAEAKLAEGLISEAAWLEVCQAKAAEDYAEWLANPETEAERFTMLRAARDAKLAATDYLAAPDYPLTEEQRAAVTAYRQALRDLPAQDGAPWDGGGEGTPWPEAPALEPVQEEE